jgi:hypothetical protein
MRPASRTSAVLIGVVVIVVALAVVATWVLPTSADAQNAWWDGYLGEQRRLERNDWNNFQTQMQQAGRDQARREHQYGMPSPYGFAPPPMYGGGFFPGPPQFFAPQRPLMGGPGWELGICGPMLIGPPPCAPPPRFYDGGRRSGGRNRHNRGSGFVIIWGG